VQPSPFLKRWNMNILFSIVFFALGTFIPGTSVMAEDLVTILLTSESQTKVEAAYMAFTEIFPDSEIHIVSKPGSSGIASQPISRESGLQGVYNRMNDTNYGQESSLDFILSIENFLEAERTNEGKTMWKDTAAVLIKNVKNEKEQVGFSGSVAVLKTYVKKAENLSPTNDETGLDVTVGEVIASENASIDPKDWQKRDEFGGISRKDILAESIFKTFYSDDLAYIKSKIKNYEDFPKPGIQFKDFFPVMNDPKAFQICIDLLAKRYQHRNIEAIVGLESRGFILGAALAYKMNVPFVPVRKPGKLPGKTYTVSYEKEYGTDTIELSQNSLVKEQRVLVIDDLIATGGSAKAAIEIISQAEAMVVEFVSLLEIPELEGRKKVGVPSFNLIDLNS
jgi:adenine phosphoribosyltransferase